MAVKIFPNLDQQMPAFMQGGQRFPPVDPLYSYVGRDIPLTAVFADPGQDRHRESRWEIRSDRHNLPISVQAAVGHERVRESVDHENKRVFVNTIRVPDAGGDRHTVVCKKIRPGLKKDRKVLELEVETWRKVWFTIYVTDDSQAALVPGLAAAVIRAFEPAQIAMVHVPAPDVLDFPHNIAVEAQKDDINHGANPYARAMFGGQWPELKRRPFHVMVVLLKQMGQRFTAALRYRVRPEVGEQGDNFVRAARSPEGVWTVTFLPVTGYCPLDPLARAQVAAARGGDYGFIDTVRSLKCLIGEDPTEYEYSGQIPALVEDWPRITLTLDGPLQVLSDWLSHGSRLEFRLTIDQLDLGFAGANFGNGIFLETHEGDLVAGEPAALKSAEHMQKALIHEFGHAFGLVPRPPPLHFGVRIPRWTHNNQYDEHGGTGSHCRVNARLDGRDHYVHDHGTMCVMYHAVSDDAGPAFCDECLMFLRQRSLVSHETGTMLDWRTYGR